MIGDIVAPISKITARDILKGVLADDPRFQRIPTNDEAEKIAQELYHERNMFVDPTYLLDVWCEFMKGE